MSSLTSSDPYHHITLKHRRSILERIEKFISPHYFTDVNLFGRLFKEQCFPTSVQHYSAPDRISYNDATQNIEACYKPVKLPFSFGPTFSTHWFKVLFVIPNNWLGEEVELVWNSGSEAMLWRDGEPVFGFSPIDDHGLRKSYRLSKNLPDGNFRPEMFVEVACNRELGEGKDGMINPPDMHKTFTLTDCHVTIVNKPAFDSFYDLQILYDIAKELDGDEQRGVEALLAGNDIINTLVKGEFTADSFVDARAIAARYLSECNYKGQHVTHVMGHCHIDTAWLWTYAETRRKCARSWISALALMQDHHDFIFVASQAQQYEWVKESYPRIHEQIKQQVANGKFIPVGGTWVEMDGVLPGGEAMARQFFYGQRFFEREFGVKCTEFWLPDTFGYSAALPQIMRLSGVRFFLTQKLSWSLVNKFPHHTFFWEGIDGSKCLAHFPPGDDYGMKMKPEELLRTAKKHADKGRSNDSVFLFGHGDGGGGPSEAMMQRLERVRDVAPLPRVRSSTPAQFFARVERSARDLCTWSGELFLELHNGTYTSQAQIKKQNRACEVLLHDVEAFYAFAAVSPLGGDRDVIAYPHAEIDRLWKLLLLNQFHDVIPGSCIEMVVNDALAHYRDVTTSGAKLLDCVTSGLCAALAGDGGGVGESDVMFNSVGWARDEVVRLRDGKLTRVHLPSMGFTVVDPDQPQSPVDGAVRVRPLDDGSHVIENDAIRCTIDRAGRVVSLLLLSASSVPHECVAPGRHGNQLVTFDDVPLFWDAWDVMDYHLETRRAETEVLEGVSVAERDPMRVVLRFKLKVGRSSQLSQEIQLDHKSPVLLFRTTVDWREQHKFLKVEFPCNVRATRATYEIQFGHMDRPTVQNTTWDTARYEVWAHKWMDISQYDLGVAVLNDCKYGCSAFGNLLRLSLLRSPKAPDANADMGRHSFTYALMPHRGTFQQAGVIAQAYQLNYPLRHLVVPAAAGGSFSFARVSSEAVVLETCKISHVHDGWLVVRLYESFGSRQLGVRIEFPLFRLRNVHSADETSKVFQVICRRRRNV